MCNGGGERLGVSLSGAETIRGKRVGNPGEAWQSQSQRLLKSGMHKRNPFGRIP
jgi:hypothetical protein